MIGYNQGGIKTKGTNCAILRCSSTLGRCVMILFIRVPSLLYVGPDLCPGMCGGWLLPPKLSLEVGENIRTIQQA